jgi:hypothetical protein
VIVLFRITITIMMKILEITINMEVKGIMKIMIKMVNTKIINTAGKIMKTTKMTKTRK